MGHWRWCFQEWHGGIYNRESLFWKPRGHNVRKTWVSYIRVTIALSFSFTFETIAFKGHTYKNDAKGLHLLRANRTGPAKELANCARNQPGHWQPVPKRHKQHALQERYDFKVRTTIDQQKMPLQNTKVSSHFFSKQNLGQLHSWRNPREPPLLGLAAASPGWQSCPWPRPSWPWEPPCAQDLQFLRQRYC